MSEVVFRLLLSKSLLLPESFPRIALCSTALAKEMSSKRLISLWHRRIKLSNCVIDAGSKVCYCVNHGWNTFAVECSRGPGWLASNKSESRINLEQLIQSEKGWISDDRLEKMRNCTCNSKYQHPGKVEYCHIDHKPDHLHDLLYDKLADSDTPLHVLEEIRIKSELCWCTLVRQPHNGWVSLTFKDAGYSSKDAWRSLDMILHSDKLSEWVVTSTFTKQPSHLVKSRKDMIWERVSRRGEWESKPATMVLNRPTPSREILKRTEEEKAAEARRLNEIFKMWWGDEDEDEDQDEGASEAGDEEDGDN